MIFGEAMCSEHYKDHELLPWFFAITKFEDFIIQSVVDLDA